MIKETLSDRGARYGDYTELAALAQALKSCVRAHSKYADMPPHMRESIEMILHKIARIVNGDSAYRDSWVDIAGYALLITEEIVPTSGKEI